MTNLHYVDSPENVAYYLCPWAPTGFLSVVGKFRGLETKIPQRGVGMEPRWECGGLEAKPPEADNRL